MRLPNWKIKKALHVLFDTLCILFAVVTSNIRFQCLWLVFSWASYSGVSFPNAIAFLLITILMKGFLHLPHFGLLS